MLFDLKTLFFKIILCLKYLFFKNFYYLRIQLPWGAIWSETQLPQNTTVSVSNLLRRQSAPKHFGL